MEKPFLKLLNLPAPTYTIDLQKYFCGGEAYQTMCLQECLLIVRNLNQLPRFFYLSRLKTFPHDNPPICFKEIMGLPHCDAPLGLWLRVFVHRFQRL